MVAGNGFGNVWCLVAMPVWLAGCAAAPLDRAGSLSSYDRLTESDGVLTKSKLHVDGPAVLAAKTVHIIPTVFSASAENVPISEKQRGLITNSVDRSMCIGLSDRFRIVGASEGADLTVHAVVTHMIPTDEKAVGVSKVASVAKTVVLPGVPVPIPRLPIGLGSLSMEAEATGPGGDQLAAMVWGRGANFLSGSARVSTSGDAYELASVFGNDFSKMLVSGKTPFKSGPSLPSMQKFNSMLGGAPKEAACEAYGRSPGVAGMIGGAVGMPESWTDKRGAGAAPSAPPTATN